MPQEKTIRRIRQITDLSLSFLFPDVCQICHEHPAGKSDGYLCRACREGRGGLFHVVPPFCGRCGLPFDGDMDGDFQCGNCADLNLRFDLARSAVRTSPLILEVIHRYKYQHQLWFEPALVDLLETLLVSGLNQHSFDFVVPIPLHRIKERERGFNQAQRLSHAVSKRLGLPCLPKALIRSRPTETRTRLSRRQRLQNVKQAFEKGPQAHEVKGKRILLVDDILTTGATASACASVLKKSGAGSVVVATVSRGS